MSFNFDIKRLCLGVLEGFDIVEPVCADIEERKPFLQQIGSEDCEASGLHRQSENGCLRSTHEVKKFGLKKTAIPLKMLKHSMKHSGGTMSDKVFRLVEFSCLHNNLDC